MRIPGNACSPKCCAPVLRTASYPRQFGEGEHGVFAGDIVPRNPGVISATEHEASSTSCLHGAGEGCANSWLEAGDVYMRMASLAVCACSNEMHHTHPSDLPVLTSNLAPYQIPIETTNVQQGSMAYAHRDHSRYRWGIMPCASHSCGPSAQPAVRRCQDAKHLPMDPGHSLLRGMLQIAGLAW